MHTRIQWNFIHTSAPKGRTHPNKHTATHHLCTHHHTHTLYFTHCLPIPLPPSAHALHPLLPMTSLPATFLLFHFPPAPADASSCLFPTCTALTAAQAEGINSPHYASVSERKVFTQMEESPLPSYSHAPQAPSGLYTHHHQTALAFFIRFGMGGHITHGRDPTVHAALQGSHTVLCAFHH